MKSLLRIAILAAMIATSTSGFFYFRDNVSTHYPMKVLQGEVLSSGKLPLWIRASGGGQPMAGNPNLLTFYPDTLLFLFLPSIVAFNLHFVLHLAAGMLTMRHLLRTIALDDDLATRCATLYLFSGAALSVTTFYNLVVAFAWIPLAVASAIRLRESGSVRDTLALGVSCGLLGLAAEPMIVVSTLLLLLILTLDRRWMRRLVQIVAAILIAAFVASPQLIAFSEIATDIERASYRFSTETVLNASISPQRIAEIALGPLQGRITDLTDRGFGRQKSERFPPFLPSVFMTVLILPAIVLGSRAGAPRAALAFALLVFFALGRFNPLVAFFVESAPSFRIGRFPEKLMIVATVAGIVLIAAAVSRFSRWTMREVVTYGIAPLFLLAVIAWMKLPEDRARIALFAAIQLSVLLISVRSTRLAVDASILIAAVCFFWQLPVDRRAAYEEPTKLRGVIPWRASVVHDAPAARRELPESEATALFRSAVIFGDPIVGAKDGVRYVLDGSPDGMHSFLSRIARERSTGSRDLRTRYGILGGAQFLVANDFFVANEPRADVAGEILWGPNRAFVSKLAALPPLHAPERLHAVSSVNDAVAAIESPRFQPGVDAVVPRDVRQSAPVEVVAYQEETNGFRARVHATQETVLITRETWFRAWNVEVDGRQVRTFPANLDRLAFVIPPGPGEITATFSRRNDAILYSWLLSLSICGIGAVAPVIRSRKRIASPAR